MGVAYSMHKETWSATRKTLRDNATWERWDNNTIMDLGVIGCEDEN